MPDRLAVVTGASSGLGYQFARLAAEDGHELIICADEDDINDAAAMLRSLGAKVEAHVVDLSTAEGLDAFWERIRGRDIDLLFANAGRALGHAFHEQEWGSIRRLIELNVRQTTLLLHRAGKKMHARGSGRILVTGSIGGFVPGPFDAVYNATKAHLDSLCYALQDEWRDSAVTLTCLMPGPVDTPIFHREGNRLSEARIAGSDSKDDPVEVAQSGYDALMKGERGAIPGARARLVTMLSGLVPGDVLARIHRWGAEPQP